MRCDYIIDKLCDRYDELIAKYDRTGSLALIGDQQSPFFKAMKAKCCKVGIKCVEQRKKDTRAIIIDMPIKSMQHYVRMADIMDIDSVFRDGYSAVSWATAEVLVAMDLTDSMHILIIGRGHATKNLAYLLSKMGATVTIAHSKTKNLIEMCEMVDVVVCAAPFEVATKAKGIGPKRLLLDISGATNPAYLASCDYSKRIGKLTTSILAYRFTKTPVRK